MSCGDLTLHLAHNYVTITGQIPATPCIVSPSLDLLLCVVLVCRARGYKSAEAHLAPMMSFLARSIPAMTLTRSTLVSCCEAEERQHESLRTSTSSEDELYLVRSRLWC